MITQTKSAGYQLAQEAYELSLVKGKTIAQAWLIHQLNVLRIPNGAALAICKTFTGLYHNK